MTGGGAKNDSDPIAKQIGKFPDLSFLPHFFFPWCFFQKNTNENDHWTGFSHGVDVCILKIYRYILYYKYLLYIYIF